MLKLRRLRLSGFKSFVDQNTIDVAGGMTAIVGPNGCGKSNIADAVVWALGERSAKSLRGEKMEDVIFAGTQRRKPLGMAEVVLELHTDNGFATTDDGLLTVGRRVFRTGESQYSINGKTVRLKDVKDLLMDTGLGIRSYSMIEQGQIGIILSSKPVERRRLLEEAAGITRYKERRRLAEVKLEEARANLARLDDIVSEVERSVRSLKRQSNAARRYQDRQSEFDGLRRKVLLGRWSIIQRQLEGYAGRLQVLEVRDGELAALLHRNEAAFAEGREALEVLAGQLGDKHQESADLAATIEGKQEFLKGSRQRLEELSERVVAGAAAAEQRSQRLTELEAELGNLDKRGEDLQEEHSRAAGEVTADDERISQIEKLVSEAGGRVESFRGRLLVSINDLTAQRNRLHREQVDVEKAEFRKKQLQGESSQKTDHLRDNDKRLAETTDLVAKLQAVTEDFESSRNDRRQALEELEKERDNLEASGKEVREELAGLVQRREVLLHLGERQQEKRQAVSEVLLAAGLGAPSYLADHLEVPEGWASSLDLYLGELEDAVVVETETEALSLSRALAAGPETARVLQAGGDEPLQHPAAPDDPAVRRPLGEALGLPASLAAALPPAFLVDSTQDACRLARLHPGTAFLSRDRLWAQAGALHIQGSGAMPGQLARERELERVKTAIPPLERRLLEIDKGLARTTHGIAVAQQRAAQAADEAAASASELAVARARFSDDQTRQRRLDVERQTLETETSEVERELAMIRDRIDRLTQEIASSELRHKELEGAFDRAQTEAEDVRGERETTRTSGASRRGRLEVLQERLDSHEQEIRRTRSDIEQNRLSVEGWRAESTRLHDRQQDIRRRMDESEKELEAALEQREETRQEVVTCQEGLDEKRAELRTVEETLEATRTQLDEIRAETSDERVAEAGVKQEADHLRGTFGEEFDEPLPLRAGEPPANLESLESDLERCKTQLERLGPVNLLAAEEFDEQKERQEFLTTQRADVKDSVDRLQRTIREINETSNSRFLATFEEVNEGFRKTFVDLFRGGEAEMRLLDEDDPLDSGIEIVARPPGKRLQNIMLLSGGEKALTAIALLFALFKTKPSPFCILDEVDAPLDDVNTLRFVEMLRKMSGETQFVVITHNKLTMEAASLLYGVTMQERGVSNLVSVELDDIAPQPQAEPQPVAAAG